MAPKFLKQLTQRLNPDLQIFPPTPSASPSASPSPKPPASPIPPVVETKSPAPIVSPVVPTPAILTHDFGSTSPPSPAPAATRTYKGIETTRLPSPSLIVPDSTTSTITTSTFATTKSTKGKEPATIASEMASVRDSDKSKPYFPLAGQAQDGYSNAEEATATCFCGAVQLAFPVAGPGLLSTFVCNCTDCRKITASMFASNFTVDDRYLKHLRGQENLKTYGQKETIASGHMMTNYFCQTCGTLMYRVGTAFPNCSILRLGTVDDFNLVETKLKPTRELFIKDRVSWFKGVEGDEVKRKESML